ncbi:MAG: hypothetical protein RMJ43_10020 [Chloroherpetonaceae bacterium]|nr:hypothetical protein [Chthonomonadaceae bacterium]MDW8208163.1 hypothetical protein [Chloroherpetonaceae bacterium]
MTDRKRAGKWNWQAFAVVAGSAVFAWIGWGVRQSTRPAATRVTARVLEGSWELQMIDGASPGTDARGLLSQRVTFQGRRLSGETRLRLETAAVPFIMPFPDASVDRVVWSRDGREATVYWQGTYRVRSHRNLDLHVGKARYRTNVLWKPDTLTLQLDHDVILTYPGPAIYRPVRPRAGTQTASTP